MFAKAGLCLRLSSWELSNPAFRHPGSSGKLRASGCFVGDPGDVEAYAFHAMELHRVIRFHERPSHDGPAARDITLGRAMDHHRILSKNHDPLLIDESDCDADVRGF